MNAHGSQTHDGESGGVATAPQQDPGAHDNGNAHSNPHAMDEHAIPQNLHKPKTITVILVLLLFLALMAGLFVIGWLPHVRMEEQTGADAKNQGSNNLIVGVVHPKETALLKNLELPCNVKPNQQTDLYPQATGYLKKLNVDIQSEVKEGEVLAVIDTPEVDAQLDQSRAALDQSKAAVVTAQSNLDLTKKTLDHYTSAQKETSGSIAETDLEQKQAAYDQGVAALAQAQANVKAAEANVHQLVVTQNFEKVVAPFPGTITVRNFDVGAYLSATNFGPGKQLFSMVDSSTMRVFVSVPQVYVTQIKNGQPAFLNVSNYPGREFKGNVRYKADALDPNTRTMQIELDFPNPKNELYAGMYGTARVAVSDERPLLSIPSGALIFNASGVQVALVREGKIHFQKIAVGRDMGTELEVRDGLSRENLIVTSPGERLTEGLDVQTLLQDAPPTEGPKTQPHETSVTAK